MAGFCQGAGVGLALASWMVNGEPDGDIFALDVSRFGPYASPAYVREKATEFYSRRFRIAYPNEYWPAARPCEISPLYERLVAKNAVHGVSYGLEYPLYFAAKESAPVEIPSLHRSNAFSRVGIECRTARRTGGILDASSFSRFEVSGPGAQSALDRLLAGRLPDIGRARLTPMLAVSGRLMGDLTTARLSDERFILFGSGYLQAWHLRWFHEHLPARGVTVRNLTAAWGGISLFGPRSRELLGAVTDEDVSSEAFPFMSVRLLEVAGAPALALRMSVTGELGFEIHGPPHQIQIIYDQLSTAALSLGIVDVGMYSLLSLRMEKGFGIWSREFSRDYTPMECGLSRFVAYDKPGFVGREAALRDRDRKPGRRLALMAVDASNADASFLEPVWAGHRQVGFITSAAFGHTCDRSLALGYVDTALVESEAALEVSILGKHHACRILSEAPCDPRGSRMRS